MPLLNSSPEAKDRETTGETVVGVGRREDGGDGCGDASSGRRGGNESISACKTSLDDEVE